METPSYTPQPKDHCHRCGAPIFGRADYRKHKKCPMPQMERVQRAFAFQNEEWVAELQQLAKAGDLSARRLFLQKEEAHRDFALLQKQYNFEQARMAAQGKKLDGTPLMPEEPEQINQKETEDNAQD